jgi:hypothetical protein
MRLWCKLAVLAVFVGVVPAAVPPAATGQDAAFKREIDSSVNRAINFLKNRQREDGLWAQMDGAGGWSEQNVGATALCALALVECGVPIDDPCIERAAAVVRSRIREINYNYTLATALLFLDRVNKGDDTDTIVFLADKLLRAQYENGRWSYYANQRGGHADNSNTQFAVLALWVARVNYKVKANAALLAADRDFRQHQQRDGGWGYQFVMGQLGVTTPSMTCAGLFVLAAAHFSQHERVAVLEGNKPEAESQPPTPRAPEDPLAKLKRDPQVLAAREYLSKYMEAPGHQEHFVYFLWSLERVCMIYNFKHFNGLDWYEWGAKKLFAAQREDGGWQGDPISGRNSETAWAMLFLRKVNLIPAEAVLEGGKLPRMERKPEANKPPRKPVPDRRPGKPGEAQALKEDLRTAVGENAEEILEKLEKTIGGEYTTALVEAIATARPNLQEPIRQALKRRLQRMSVNTLTGYLKSPELELRLAAVNAAAAKGDKEIVPDLIPVLGDRDPTLVRAAYQALKKLTGKDHGPKLSAWQRWWDAGGK